MAELGSLGVKFTAEGLQDLLNGLKSVAGATDNVAKRQSAASKSMKKDLADEARFRKETAQKNKKLDDEELKTKESSIKKQKKLYEDLYLSVGKQAQASVQKQIAMEEQATRMMNREFDKRGEAHMKSIRKMEHEELSSRKRLANAIGGGVQRGFQTAGLMAGGAMAAFGGGMMYSAYEQDITVRKRAAELANITRSMGAGKEIKFADTMKNIYAQSTEQKVSPTDLIEGQLELARHTGRADLVQSMAPFLAKVGKAEGGEDSSAATKTAATMASQIIAESPTITKDELQAMILNELHIAKTAQIPFADVAGHASRAMSVVTNMGVNGPARLKELQQVMSYEQIAFKGGAVNAAQASESVERFFSSIVKHGKDAKGLAKMGLRGEDIFADKGHRTLLGSEQIIENVIAGARGNLGKLQSEVSAQGIRLLNPITAEYNKAEMAKPGTGRQAIRDYIERETQSKTKTEMSELNLDKATMDNATSVQDKMQAELNRLSADIDKNFPALTQGMGMLTGAMGGLKQTLALSMLGGPVGAAGGKILGSIASNAIGKAVVAVPALAGVAGMIGPAALAGAAGLGIGSVVGTHMLNKEIKSGGLTAEQVNAGSAAQHGATPHDEGDKGVLDKFLIGMGSLVVSLANLTGSLEQTPMSAGPKGPNLPGSHQ